MRPDLAVLVAYYQKTLRLQDWRVSVQYVANLATDDGRAVWGLCRPLVDNKTATIAIRDPETPPDGSTPEEALRQVEETVAHELCHLHFAAFGNVDHAAIAAEEQAVWALSEALVAARGTPQEATIARAMIARMRVASKTSAPRRRAGGVMDKELAQAALDALESGDAEKCASILKGVLVASITGGEEPGAESAPPAAEAEVKPGEAPPPEGEEKMASDAKYQEQAATAARRARAADSELARLRSAADAGTHETVRTMIHNAREIDGVPLTPAVEKMILEAKTIEDARRSLGIARGMLTDGKPRARAQVVSADKEEGAEGIEKLSPRERAAHADLIATGRKEAAATYLKIATRRLRAVLAQDGK